AFPSIPVRERRTVPISELGGPCTRSVTGCDLDESCFSQSFRACSSSLFAVLPSVGDVKRFWYVTIDSQSFETRWRLRAERSVARSQCSLAGAPMKGRP